MSNQYITNSDIYQVNAERDVFVILSRFNTEYIYDCIDNALSAKNNAQLITSNPNLVRSIEDNFIVMQQQFPDDKSNIMECREETYSEIINYLCSKFNIEFTEDSGVDLYSAAYYLYDFLVSNYLNYLVSFYSNFILKEKNTIYKDFNLEQFKKNTMINYNKKLFKDGITTTILINISYVIDQLTTFDFDFSDIINTVYPERNIANFMNSIYEDQDRFYKFYVQDLTNPMIRPNIITNIRLTMQNAVVNEELMMSSILKQQM